LEGRVKLGAVTLNEMRDALGLDPFATPAADRPMVLTATGYVPIEAGVGGEGAVANAPGANAKTAPLVEKRSVFKDYDPDEPRVPAGNPDGGQWTSGGEVPATLPAVANDDPITPARQYASTLVIKHPGAWTGD